MDLNSLCAGRYTQFHSSLYCRPETDVLGDDRVAANDANSLLDSRYLSRIFLVGEVVFELSKEVQVLAYRDLR